MIVVPQSCLYTSQVLVSFLPPLILILVLHWSFGADIGALELIFPDFSVLVCMCINAVRPRGLFIYDLQAAAALQSMSGDDVVVSLSALPIFFSTLPLSLFFPSISTDKI